MFNSTTESVFLLFFSYCVRFLITEKSNFPFWQLYSDWNVGCWVRVWGKTHTEKWFDQSSLANSFSSSAHIFHPPFHPTRFAMFNIRFDFLLFSFSLRAYFPISFSHSSEWTKWRKSRTHKHQQKYFPFLLLFFIVCRYSTCIYWNGELQNAPELKGSLLFIVIPTNSSRRSLKTERGKELQNKFAASLKQTNIVFEQINIVFLYYVIIIQWFSSLKFRYMYLKVFDVYNIHVRKRCSQEWIVNIKSKRHFSLIFFFWRTLGYFSICDSPFLSRQQCLSLSFCLFDK